MFAKLVNNLDTLGFSEISSYLPEYLNRVVKDEISVQDALIHITEREISKRDERAAQVQISVAHFPYVKTMDEYDYSFQPGVSKTQIKDLCSLRFIEGKENILFYGTPGTGKTHLAVSIGIEAAKKRNLVYFITCHDLIQSLKKAHDENRLESRLRHFCKHKLLIIDEIGYLPVDKTGANLFFQLITRRYEKSSTIITTNQPFSKWGEVFSDLTLANAILDRLLHHSYIIKMVGPSYRTKDIHDFIEDDRQR